MKHEKIIKRKDGTQYQIRVSAYMNSYRNETMNYNIDLFYKKAGKRKWLNVPDTLHDHEIRSLSIQERRDHKAANMLNYVTQEEIYQAKLELWELCKPSK